MPPWTRPMWLCALVVACKGSSPAPSSSTPSPVPTATPAAAASVIAIRPITITFGGQPIARLFADGRTEAVGSNRPGGAMSPGPTLHADGTIELTKRGLTARLSRQGEIHGAQDELFGRIDGEHLTFGTNGIHLEGDLIVFDDRRDDVGLIEGPVDAAMRRTALVMFAAFLIDTSLTP